MRSWLAYRFLRWALWLDTGQTVALSAAMVAENARRNLEAQGLHVVRGEDGLPTLQPIEEHTKDPTIH